MEKSDCIFCKIVDGEVPAHIVFENSDYMAFLDINPHVEGHTIVIPKKHYRWVYDIKNIGEYWETIQTVTKQIDRALKPEFLNYFTYGMDAPHAHVHILPRKSMKEKDILPKQPKDMPSTEELHKLAKKIRD